MYGGVVRHVRGGDSVFTECIQETLRDAKCDVGHTLGHGYVPARNSVTRDTGEMGMCPRAQYAKNVTWVTLPVHIVGACYCTPLCTYYVRTGLRLL